MGFPITNSWPSSTFCVRKTPEIPSDSSPSLLSPRQSEVLPLRPSGGGARQQEDPQHGQEVSCSIDTHTHTHASPLPTELSEKPFFFAVLDLRFFRLRCHSSYCQCNLTIFYCIYWVFYKHFMLRIPSEFIFKLDNYNILLFVMFWL